MVKHLAVIAALALATPVQAQTATVDPDQIEALLKDAGYPAEQIGDQSGYRQVMSRGTNYQFSVDLFDCAAGKACQTVLLYTAFKKADDTPTNEAIAAYSDQHPGSRMFLDRRGSPAIELELDLPDDGITAAWFTDSLKTWETMLAGFAGFLSGQPAPAAPAAAAATSAPAAPAPAAAVADAT